MSQKAPQQLCSTFGGSTRRECRDSSVFVLESRRRGRRLEDPLADESREGPRTRPTNFRLACRILECIRSKSLFRRFRRGFVVSSRSVELRVTLPIIPYVNVSSATLASYRRMYTCICTSKSLATTKREYSMQSGARQATTIHEYLHVLRCLFTLALSQVRAKSREDHFFLFCVQDVIGGRRRRGGIICDSGARGRLKENDDD